jgi:ABC-type transport system involved in multi-copper enzyme maturation permease subunit
MNRNPIWICARLTLKEAIRRKIVLVAVLLGIAFLLVYGTGLHFVRREMIRDGTINRSLIANQILSFLTLSGLYAVNFMFTLIAVLTSVDTIAGEIASGTIQSLAAKPVRRWQILLGKWVGFVLMLTLYLALMAGGVIGASAAITGYRLNNIPAGVALIWLNGIVMLNVSLLGGTRLSTLANGVIVFATFGIAFVGSWVEQIGAFLDSQAAVNVGIVSSLLMPSEAVWKRAAYEMQSVVSGAAGFANPFTASFSVPSVAMIVYAALYALVALALALWSFERRDL